MMIATVIGLNSLIALGVCWLACRLWQWRSGLVEMNQGLQNAQLTSRRTPQAMGYQLMLKRTQITQARLGVAQWQLRSRQIRQIIRLLSLLRTLLLYRAGRGRSESSRSRSREIRSRNHHRPSHRQR